MQLVQQQDLTGKTALVTGGTSGIGRAAALLFHAAGARVTLTGAHSERTELARGELPREIDVLQADVRNSEDAERLALHLSQTYGALDVVFLNAGIAQIAPFDAATEAHYTDQMDINVRGALLTLQKLSPLLPPARPSSSTRPSPRSWRGGARRVLRHQGRARRRGAQPGGGARAAPDPRQRREQRKIKAASGDRHFAK